jgi:hypothetical protein
MLMVRLLDDYAGRERRFGPIDRVTVLGPELTLPGHPTATFRGGRWSWGAGSFLSLETEVPSRIELKSESRGPLLRGPFESVRIIGGLIHVCQPDRQPFARLDNKSGLWHIYSDWSIWPELAILAAETQIAAGQKPADA